MTNDDPKITRLLDALAAGHFVDEACQYAPIHKSTYYRWLQQGEALEEKVKQGGTLTAEETKISELCDSLKKAEVAGQNAALDTIREAIRGGTWQAAAWWLERTNPQQFGRKVQAEVTGRISVDDLERRMLELIGDDSTDIQEIES